MTRLVIYAALALAALLVVYALFLLSHPVITCPMCHGAKVIKRGKGRADKCRRCRATGLAVPFGAGAVHRFYWSVSGDRAMERRREAGKERIR